MNPNQKTLFLASVRSLDEARIVYAGGADIIDLKEPSMGSLGAVTQEVMREITAFISGRRPVSATIGDLFGAPEIISDKIASVAATGVDIIKVGFFDRRGRRTLCNALSEQTRRGVKIVAVLFADREERATPMIDLIAGAGCYGIMLDTADKQKGRLLTLYQLQELIEFIQIAREYKLLVGLAGSLRVDDIVPLRGLGPDYLGFRGALCQRNARKESIDPTAVQLVRTQLEGTDKLETIPAEPYLQLKHVLNP
jgi:(5-formylfuran-3-yl)methyl phosphate synthase